MLLLILLTGLDHRFFGGEAGLVSFSLAELGAYFLLVVLFLDFCARGATYRSDVAWKVRTSNGFVWVYFAWAFVSAGWNMVIAGNRDALHSLKDTIPALVVFIALVTLVSDRRRLAFAHRAALLMLVLLSSLAICQQVFGGPYPTQVDPNAYLKVTVTGASLVAHPVVGTLGHPNGLAEFLAPLLVLCVGYVVHDRGAGSPVSNVGWLAAIVVFFLALFLTQGKWALAWALVGLALTISFSRLRIAFTPVRGSMIVAALILAALGGLAVLFLATDHLPESLRPGTLATRMLINYSALQEALDSRTVMIFGGGLKLFGESAAGSTLKLGVHGEYLSQLLRFGLPGALIFIALLFNTIRGQGRSGWIYAMPPIVLAVIYLLESAAGSQLQTLPLLLSGFAEANRIVTATEHAPAPVVRVPGVKT